MHVSLLSLRSSLRPRKDHVETFESSTAFWLILGAYLGKVLASRHETKDVIRAPLVGYSFHTLYSKKRTAPASIHLPAA